MTNALSAVGAVMLPELLGHAFWPVIGTLLVIEVLVFIGYRVRTGRWP